MLTDYYNHLNVACGLAEGVLTTSVRKLCTLRPEQEAPALDMVQDDDIIDTSFGSTLVVDNTLGWYREQAVSIRVSQVKIGIFSTSGFMVPLLPSLHIYRRLDSPHSPFVH